MHRFLKKRGYFINSAFFFEKAGIFHKKIYEYSMEFIQKPDIRERVLERGLLYPTDEELIMLILGS